MDSLALPGSKERAGALHRCKQLAEARDLTSRTPSFRATSQAPVQPKWWNPAADTWKQLDHHPILQWEMKTWTYWMHKGNSQWVIWLPNNTFKWILIEEKVENTLSLIRTTRSWRQQVPVIKLHRRGINPIKISRRRILPPISLCPIVDFRGPFSINPRSRWALQERRVITSKGIANHLILKEDVRTKAEEAPNRARIPALRKGHHENCTPPSTLRSRWISAHVAPTIAKPIW